MSIFLNNLLWRWLLLAPALFLCLSCSSTEPAIMLRSDGAKKESLTVATQAIKVPKNKIISIELEEAVFPRLPEKAKGAGRRIIGRHQEGYGDGIPDSFGNREVLIYVTIYKNGRQVGQQVISDIARSVLRRHKAPITNPRFFTELMDSGYYEFELNAYEVDTSGLVRAYRRLEDTDITALEATYNFGGALAKGVTDVVKGAGSIATSLFGQPLDNLLAQANSVHLFKHSFYIVASDPTDTSSDTIINLNQTRGTVGYYIVSNVDHNFLEYKHSKPGGMPTSEPTEVVEPLRVAEIFANKKMRPWYQYVKFTVKTIGSSQ